MRDVVILDWQADGAMRVLRDWRHGDGADGESAHLLCDYVDQLRLCVKLSDGALEVSRAVAYERWKRIAQQVHLLNMANISVTTKKADDYASIAERSATVVTPARDMLQLRANYVLLFNAVTELLGLEPGRVTVSDVAEAMAQRAYEATRAKPT